jgi:hypothetical protein
MRRLIAAFRPAVARMMASSAPCSPSATVAWVIHAPISVGPRSAAGSLATRIAREDLVQVLHGRSQRIEPPRPDQIEREQAQQLERAQTGNRTGLAADVQRRRRPADVQLMGLCQSKGREADATIVVLRGNDYFGKESEPMPVGWARSFSTLCLPGADGDDRADSGLDPSFPLYPLAVLSARS